MYFVGLILFIVFLVFSTMLSGSLASFIDLPSILIILSFSVPILMASGLFSDFIRGFKIMGKKVNIWSIIELSKTELALRLAIKLLLFSGLLGSIIGIISILANSSSIDMIGPNLAVASLTLLYSVLIVFILFPVQAKVKAMILTMDKEYIDEETAK